MKIRVLIGAWLFAMASGAAYALGLGEILVKSRLNQPLDAEIVVREAVPGEAEQLVAKLASPDDFARIGLERARTPVMLRFETAQNDRGQTIIKVTSDEPVREPFLTLLVEANWSGGRLLREYGVLLDPAVTAPASTIARMPAPTPARPAPEPAAPPATTTTPEPAAAQQAAAPAPKPAAPAQSASPPPASHPASPPPRTTGLPPGFAPPPRQQTPTAPPAVESSETASRAAADGRYTVERGDTLSGIARDFAAQAGVTTNQMMVALQRDNPGAFFADNINALKAGAVLRVPDAEAARSQTNADATAEVRRQNQTWSGETPALADAGAAPVSRPAAPATPTRDARLELVPPGADAAGGEAAGPSGTEQGGADVAETRAELQRTREELRSRDQEVSELASRVRDLEELNAKNARLLELKDVEVAELQRRLAEAGTVDSSPDSTAADVAAAPDPEPATEAPDETASADDTTALPTEEDIDVETDTLAQAESDASTAGDTISSMGEEVAAESPDPVTSAVDSEAATTDAGEGTEDGVAPEMQSEDEWAAAAAGGESDPFADTDAPSAADSWTPATPETDAPAQADPATASDTTAMATTTATPAPAETSTPWYMRPMVQGAGLIGLALILLLVLLARRQRSQASSAESAPPKRSVADLFSDTPAPGAAAAVAGSMAAGSASDNEEALDLQRQITSDPDNFGAYLELLSLYYAEGDRESFETWAERFHERPGAPVSIEWDQVRSMGEELVPGHELFDGGGSRTDDDVAEPLPPVPEAFDTPSWETAAAPDATEHDDATDRASSAPAVTETTLERRVTDISGTEFSFDEESVTVDDDDVQPIEFSLDDLDAAAPAPASASAAMDTADKESGNVLDTLAPLDFDETPAVPVKTDDATDSDSTLPADEAGLDDVATKLELARAYLDMGDPDGARAMLEEVLGEGDTSQRDEARKMLATL